MLEAAANLSRTARTLQVEGLHLVPVGRGKVTTMRAGYTDRPLSETTTEALEQIASGAVKGFGVVTGPASTHVREGQSVMLAALELEGKATASKSFTAEWDDAVQFTEAAPVMARLEAGWKEATPSGGVRWFFFVPVTDREYGEWVVKSLKGRLAATRSGDTYAELLLNKSYVIAAPSHGDTHPTGKPWTLLTGGPSDAPVLTVAEVHLLAAALTEVGDAKPTAANDAMLSGRAREVGLALNRSWTMSDSVTLLKTKGWQEVGTDRDGSTVMEPVNNPGHGRITVSNGTHSMAGAVWSFSTSAEPFEAEVLYRPLDVVGILSHGGSREAAAENLLSENRVSLKPFALMTRERQLIVPASTPTDVLVREVGTALVNAKHPTRGDEPFVLAEESQNGEPVSMLTVTREGSIRRWSVDQLDTLILSVTQPARAHVKKIKNETTGEVEEQIEYSYLHKVDAGVVDSVFPNGRPVTGLAAVRYVAECPVLTAEGAAISTPGYHRGPRALVAIPRRERVFWEGYRVPAKPSKREAQRAFDFLIAELTADFPFETPGDRARFVAYLLTAASRSLYGAAPAFLFDAADRGTGKSLMASVGRLAAFGSTKRQAVGYAARDDEETRKSLVAAALSDVRAAHVDELPRGQKVTSTVLSELITDAGGMEIRKLGTNSSVHIPPMLVTVCGNNAELGGDANRRFLPVRLVHKSEGLAFERSGFRHPDLLAFVQENRPQILAALHTMLAHGIQNPVAVPSGFGSFEGWASVVLTSLAHAEFEGSQAAELAVEGRSDFLDAQDEEGQEWAPLMMAMYETFGEQWAKSAQIHERITGLSPAIELPADLLPFAGGSDSQARRQWGRALHTRRSTSVRHAGVVYRLDMLPDPKRGHGFRVVVTGEPASEAPVTETAPATEKAAPKPVVKKAVKKTARKPVGKLEVL